MAARHFACIDFDGADAAAFLQGYLTADLDALERSRGLPMALCNIKGRVITSGWAFGEPTHVSLLVHESVTGEVERELGKYLLFAKSKLSISTRALRFAPNLDGVELPGLGYSLDPDAEHDEGHDAFADACVEAGFVVVSNPVSQTFLPQMIGLTDAGAVNFSKGCYLGQEVVARAQHRGQVKRRLQRFPRDGTPPTPGDDWLQGGTKAGTVIAVGNNAVLACTRTQS